jgi:hypothetical protein
MSDPEMTPSRSVDDAGGKRDGRGKRDASRTLSDDVTIPAEAQIEDQTVAIETASGGTQSPGDDDE